jgi:hypothetical protein
MLAQNIPRQVQRIPPIQNYENRDTNLVGATSPFGYDALMYNCYPEVLSEQLTQDRKLFVRSRPGYKGLLRPGVGAGRGAYWWDVANKFVVAIGQNVYFVDITNNTASLVAALTLQSGFGEVRFTEVPSTTVGGAGLFILEPSNIAGYNKIYRISSAGALVATYTIPTNSQSFPVWFDNYIFYYGIDGNVYNSNLNDPSTWSGSSFFNPNSFQDGPVALERTLNYLVAFKDYSIDFLYDAGNPTLSPLAKNPSLTINLGCLGRETVRTLYNQIFFIGQSLHGFSGVYILSNLGELKKVSTPAVDRAIKNYMIQTSLTSSYASNPLTADLFTIDGHIFYNIPQLSLMYCVESNIWIQTHYSFEQPIYFCFVNWSLVNTTFNTQNGQIYTLGGTGLVGRYDSTKYQDTDNSSVNFPIVRAIQTNRLDFGTMKRKYISRVDILGDFSGDTITMTCWDDDYVTSFSSGRTVTSSYPRASWYANGQFRRRAYTFSWQGNLSTRIHGIEVEYEMGED